MKRKNPKIGFASFFNSNDKPERASVERMAEQISKLDDVMHFTILKTEDGWSAQCDEFPGIITGGSNPDPSQEEVEKQIRDSIHVAFDISYATLGNKVLKETESRETKTYQFVSA